MKIKILRGIPGSGKSTWAEKIDGQTCERDRKALICSADDFFMKDGEYIFDPSKIGQAHAACFQKYLVLLARAEELEEIFSSIVVDNTNLQKWEISPYILAAAAHGIEDVEILNFHCSVEESIARNVHGVPAHAIERMHRTMQNEKLLPFWNVRDM